MSSTQQTADFITDQIAAAGSIRTRRMFGEFALYCDEKVVGFICDDQLFVKVTEAGKAMLDSVVYGHPYPGSKEYLLISADYWDDADYLSRLITCTADALPLSKKRR